MRPNRTLAGLAVAAVLSVLGAPMPGVGAARASAPLKVGVAKADLTWHVGQNRLGDITRSVPDVAGQDVPDDPFVFAGLHSRPWAKAIVVDGDGGRFAFVRADILLVTGDLYEAVAQRVVAHTGIPAERLLVAATHTHVANNGLFPHVVHSAVYRSFDPREQVFLADQIAAAVATAAESMRPAALAVGSGSVTLPAENRRYTDREKLDQPPFATDPVRLDPELGILRFDDAATGRPIAVMMDYGVHPVVLINNPLVSADFVTWAESGLERALTDPASGDAPMAIWFTGAQGDQDAIYVRYSYPEAEWTGRIFAAEAARVARALTPEPLTGAKIAEKVIPLPPPGGPPIPSSEIAGPRLPIDGPSPQLIPSSVRIQAIELATPSARTVLLSWPGEPIRDIGVTLKQGAHAMGFDHAFILALANDWAGYWLTPAEYKRGLYERTLMFYGRTSALYVEEHLFDLARSLTTGAAPSRVALPPKAVADRALTSAFAQAAFAADPALRSAAVAPPEPGAPSAVTEPAGVVRPGATEFVWRGGSPDVPNGWIPLVTVQQQDGADWRTIAEAGRGEILLMNRQLATGEVEWTARWEAFPDTPIAAHRFAVRGQRAVPGGQAPYTLTSAPFDVKACACLAAGPLAATPQPSGSTVVSVGAHYRSVVQLPVPHTNGGFRLQPYPVTFGSAVVEVLQGSNVVGTITLAFASNIQPVARTIIVRDISGQDLPVTISEPTELGVFSGTWTGAPGVSFRLAALTDAFGNSLA